MASRAKTRLVMESPPCWHSWRHMKLPLAQRRVPGSFGCRVAGRFNQMMIRRPATDWIHGFETTRQIVRLTAASAKVDGAILTATAPVGHPRLPSKAREAVRLFPNVE